MIDQLLSQITSQLGVSDEQASGGAGALLSFAKEKLGGDFSQISDAIPGLDGLIEKAPAAESSGDGGGGLMGAASGLLGGGGDGLLGKLGDLKGLADTFQGLDLDADKIGGFGEIIINFIREKLGDTAADLMQGLMD